MKTFLTILAISGILAGFCCAQDPSPSEAIKASPSGGANPAATGADQANYYAILNRRVIEFKAQSNLLGQLAQEHRKRAGETPRDQDAKAQWESELSKELDDKSLAFAGVLNNVRKERLAFEQLHPELVTPLLTNCLPRVTSPRNPDESAFIEKLEARLAAVQQEIAETMEAGRVYTAQLQTNTSSSDFSRIASLLQDNSNAARQLQKEASDLKLKKLEFRALRAD